MSAPLAHNQAPDRTAQVHLLCQFAETFGQAAQNNRPLRLHVLSRIRKAPLASTNDLTTDECRDLARFLREAREQPARVDAMLRRAAAELAPDAAQIAAITEGLAECGRAHADLSDLDTALALLDRLGEVTHDARFAVGDAGNILLSLAPDAHPREVLAEHLRGRERDQLRALLCPSFPPLDGLPLDLALKFEQSAVREWQTCCRVSERVPQEFRDTFVGLGYGFFRAAATTLETCNGRRLPPSREEIARRLAAVCDHEAVFLTPADLRKWALSGAETVPERCRAEKPDLIAEAYEFFKQRFHELDNTREAFVQTFERYRLSAGRAR